MGKEKKYLAIVTKNGIPEALFLEFLEKNPTFKKEWMSKAIKTYDHFTFNEVSEEEAEEGTEKYETFYRKEREREKKEFEKLREEKLKSQKEQSESDEILKPQPIKVTEEKEDISDNKPKKKNFIKRKR